MCLFACINGIQFYFLQLMGLCSFCFFVHKVIKLRTFIESMKMAIRYYLLDYLLDCLSDCFTKYGTLSIICKL